SSDANSAITMLPENPAGPGSSASIAGHGPASSKRPSSRSACSRARWSARASRRRASTSAPSCPSIAYHIAPRHPPSQAGIVCDGAGQAPAPARTLGGITGRPGIQGRRPAFEQPLFPGGRVRAWRSVPSPGMHGSHRCHSMTPEPASGAPAAIAGPNGSTPPQQQEMPLALVLGQPVVEIPRDLYIPPDALEVILDAFEGPLDLLLYLIRRQNLDILDIPVAEITRQYVDYIQAMHEMRFELAAEYLVMAAILAEIKSRMLLPRSELAEDEEGDPRAELVRRLQEYERFKQAAEDIDALPRMERDTSTVSAFVPDRAAVRLPPPVDLREMLLALHDVLKRAELYTQHAIKRDALSVRQRMGELLQRLRDG